YESRIAATIAEQASRGKRLFTLEELVVQAAERQTHVVGNQLLGASACRRVDLLEPGLVQVGRQPLTQRERRSIIVGPFHLRIRFFAHQRICPWICRTGVRVNVRVRASNTSTPRKKVLPIRYLSFSPTNGVTFPLDSKLSGSTGQRPSSTITRSAS